MYKRLWRGQQGIFGRYDRTYEERSKTAFRQWLAEQVEEFAKQRTEPFTVDRLVADLQQSAQVQAVAELLSGRRDFSLVTHVRELRGEQRRAQLSVPCLQRERTGEV